MADESQYVWLQSRKITSTLLGEFEQWTRTASMFVSSPQGAAFGEELRAVFALAKKQLRDE
jgi:hypothetical protein